MWNTLSARSLKANDCNLFARWWGMYREYYLKGKYQWTADLLFILCRFSCFAYVEWTTFSLPWSNPNQLNRSSAVPTYFTDTGMVLLMVSVLWECLFGGKSRNQNRIIFVYRHGAVSKMRSWRPLLQRDVVVDLDLSGVVRHDMGQEVAEIWAALGRRAVEAHRFLWKTNRQNVQHMLDV